MRIVVVGAAGFLGSHVVEEAVRHDVQVIAVVPPDQADGIRELGAQAVVADPTDAEAFQDALPGLLANTRFLISAPILVSASHARGDYVVNVRTTTALMDAALQPDVAETLAGVVQLSSTLTYGYGLPNLAIDESWVARPRSPAMSSLAEAERAARTYRRLPLLVLRVAPSFGSRDDGVVQRLIDEVGQVARPRLAGAGRAPVSLAYGPDIGRAVWAALEAFEETQGRILHVKSIDTDWRTVVAQARALRGRSTNALPLPLWLARRLERAGSPGRRLLAAPAGVPDYADLTGNPHLIDDTPLRALTGFTPLFGLRAALRHTIAIGEGEIALANDSA